MHLKKNTTLGKVNIIFCILIIFQLFSFSAYSEKDQINEKNLIVEFVFSEAYKKNEGQTYQSQQGPNNRNGIIAQN